jgi:hypothetical protein
MPCVAVSVGEQETLMEGLQEVMGQRTGPAINSVLFTESMDRFLQVSLPLSVTIGTMGLGFANLIAAGWSFL